MYRIRQLRNFTVKLKTPVYNQAAFQSVAEPVVANIEEVSKPQEWIKLPTEEEQRENESKPDQYWIDFFDYSGREKPASPVSTEEEDELYRAVDIMLTAHAPQILDSFGKFIELVCQEFSDLGVQFDGYTEPRVHKDRWITNKSPFKYGRHKVEYEVRTYKKVCHLLYMTGSTRKIMLNYIQRNVPAGVGIEVKSFKLVRFPEDLREEIRENKDNLTRPEQLENKAGKRLDSNKMRRLGRDHFEARRKPWNPSRRDREKEEIMAFRRQWRRPATFGRI